MGRGMLEKYRAQVVFLESLCNMGGSGSCFGNELYKCLCKVEKRVYWEVVGVAVGNTGGCWWLAESIAMLVERSLSLDWDIQVQVLRSSTLVGKAHLLRL